MAGAAVSANQPKAMTACVGLASNQDPESRLRHGLELLAARFGRCQQSTIYASAAIGEAGAGSTFLNLAVKFDTTLSWSSLRDALRCIEAQCGRCRDNRAMVALDLDRLVLFEDNCTTLADEMAPERLVRLPHVLVPLAELLPDWVHPATGATLATLITEQQPRIDSLQAVQAAIAANCAP